uniref:Uncharacterized protein n=1 Tax=Arundo donax TaxID=35708 RepID=A0A0A9FEB8_ARUDO
MLAYQVSSFTDNSSFPELVSYYSNLHLCAYATYLAHIPVLFTLLRYLSIAACVWK